MEFGMSTLRAATLDIDGFTVKWATPMKELLEFDS